MLTVSARMPVHALIVAGHSSVPSTWTAMYGLVSHPIPPYPLILTVPPCIGAKSGCRLPSPVRTSHPASLHDWILMTLPVL